MGKLKYIIMTLLCIGLLSGGVYLHIKGDKLVKDATVEAQKKSTMVDAVTVLENHKLDDNIKYSLSRKYQLPTQTLWEINVWKYGARESCSILEEYPEVNLKIDSEKYEDVIEFLQDNNIEFTEVNKY